MFMEADNGTQTAKKEEVKIVRNNDSWQKYSSDSV